MMQKEDFNKIAELLEYPQEGYQQKVVDCSKSLSMSAFCDFVKEKSLHQLQELYVRTFELDPLCNLYIGVHIFGEDGFKRGSFMAKLKEAYSKYEINENEIADFLPCILRLAAKLEDKNKYKDLIEECILGPLELMLSAFQEDTNPYKEFLVGLQEYSKAVQVKEIEIKNLTNGATIKNA